MTDYSSTQWIWQKSDWPEFHWQEESVLPLLRKVRFSLGILLGKASSTQGDDEDASALNTLLENIITSSAIEGERLNAQSVRSSLAKRLNLKGTDDAAYPTSERTEGLAEMMMDAISNLDTPLGLTRLYQWHHWLFPATEFSLNNVQSGQLRGEEPMQVVSGRIDRPTVHFEAPARSLLEPELSHFFNWFNDSRNDPKCDPLLRAAISHFWFVTLHPFDDGNGRLTRAITDLALAQADEQSIRLYAMSGVILKNRKAYYHILEKSQRGDMDITQWLLWFLQMLEETIQVSLTKIDRTLQKTRFWQQFHGAGLSDEQVKVLNRLLDGGQNGFESGISASQYQKVAKVSKATATRHLSDLLNKGCIEKLPGGGRSTRYQVVRK
ncbi:Fic family protein [Endozoicomonas numazuensis]|uniref:Cell division protein Fic n=1 Tax=Endozoicomonas numazuensis TaxID=1137799 RepID=A0A081N9H6_9GAMM|nr:Fic family protein [Endozoicomonas numazuensis]KEQ15099.1 cell division protein Fic [Endozoicomonas numazuensis]